MCDDHTDKLHSLNRKDPYPEEGIATKLSTKRAPVVVVVTVIAPGPVVMIAVMVNVVDNVMSMASIIDVKPVGKIANVHKTPLVIASGDGGSKVALHMPIDERKLPPKNLIVLGSIGVIDENANDKVNDHALKSKGEDPAVPVIKVLNRV